MNFMEAVNAMQNGEKVRRKSYEDTFRYNWIDTKEIKDNKYGTLLELDMDVIMANDWELVDEDKDWSLEKQMRTDFEITNLWDWDNSWAKPNIKKCRDLILKDLMKLSTLVLPIAEDGKENKVFEVINKRFGELK